MMGYRIQQRTGMTATLPVSGQCLQPSSGGTVEASFNGQPYADVDDSLSDGAFSGSLSSQPQGQGSLLVRVKGSSVPASVVQYVGIGDVFAVAGQSNASGQDTAALQAYSHPTLKAGCFYKDYVWRELTDPCGRDPSTDSVSAAGGATGGTVWPVLATAIMADQGVPVGIVPCAKGGSAIAAWAPGADHQDRTTLYGSMVARCLAAGGVKAVLWWQGESDAILGTSKATYKAALQALGDAIFADLGCPLIPCRFLLLGEGYASLANQTAICDAISESWGGNHILAGPNLHTTAADDGLHATTNATFATCAALWWAAVEVALYA